MKHAYVSVVLPVRKLPAIAAIEELDQVLSRETRAHEIILVVPYAVTPPDYAQSETTGPLTAVSTHMQATADTAIVAGLARAAGDFVLEWRGPIDHLDAATIRETLELTDVGNELVEAVGRETSWVSRSFYRFVNSLRSRKVPVRKTVGRLYSRHALGQVLRSTTFEPQLDILNAELPVPRAIYESSAPNPHRASMAERLGEGSALLSKGTRFGSAIPLTLAAVSAAFGIGAAIYALVILFVRGKTPEGWTTLMVVSGLGQAAILAMLGLVWARIDGLTRGLTRNQDVTASVTVSAPMRPDAQGL